MEVTNSFIKNAPETILLEILNYKKPKRKFYILLMFVCQALGKLPFKTKTMVAVSGV